MAREVQCPQGHRFSVDDAGGKTLHCPNCGAAVRLVDVDERTRIIEESTQTGEGHDSLAHTLTAEKYEAPVGFPDEASQSIRPVQFGRYRVIKLLGRGSMGAVYLARDMQLERQVALKIPHFGPDGDPVILERFFREARSAATLRHPHLCPVFDVGQIDGVHYLTMAYIEGYSLSEYVRGSASFTQEQVAILVLKLALALQEAHSHGVVHRDLKPSNIMIDSRQEPIIMDFGLAWRVGTEEVRLTSPGAIIGTPSYMSPEQAAGNIDQLGPTCDVFSLGVIFYELLCGQLPFRGKLGEILAKIARDTPEPPSHYRPGLDPELDKICMRAMAKRSADRYATMADFAKAILQFLRRRRGEQGEGEGIGEQSTSEFLAELVLDRGFDPQARGPKPQAPKPARRWWLAAAGVVACLAIAVGNFLVPLLQKAGTQEEPPPTTPADQTSAAPPPQLAVAPFSADQAAAHQKQWAEYCQRETRLTNAIGITLVLIPPGEFLMGSPEEEPDRDDDESPQHLVRITRPFYLGVYEVTQGEFQQVMGRNPSHFGPRGEAGDQVAGWDTSSFPVESVSWEEAMAFCERLSQLPEERAAGRTYRLPTEAQWEYACRAGTTTAFHFGPTLSARQANCAPLGKGEPNLQRPTTVGSYSSNLFGLHDMHGNVWEWCQDRYAGDQYARSPTNDPAGPDGPPTAARVLRGGGWLYSASYCRSACRSRSIPAYRLGLKGFRVACSIE